MHHNTRSSGLEVSRLLAVCASMLAFSACQTSWQIERTTRDYQLPHEIPIYVAVSDQVANTDNGALVLELVETLEEDLKAQGHLVSVVAARVDEPPPMPRIELQVMATSSGSSGMRGAGAIAPVLEPALGPLAIGLAYGGAPSVIVDCYVVLEPDSAPAFSGRLDALNTRSDTGWEGVGENAGHAIARRIAD